MTKTLHANRKQQVNSNNLGKLLCGLAAHYIAKTKKQSNVQKTPTIDAKNWVDIEQGACLASIMLRRRFRHLYCTMVAKGLAVFAKQHANL